MPNKLEKVILEGTKKANKAYGEIAGGWWLGHAPESFLEILVALAISKKRFTVFPEASPKKIHDELETQPRGRRRSDLRQRFDLVVWRNHSKRVRAIIEIKRGWGFKSHKQDADKIKKYVTSKAAEAQNSVGYLLVYTESAAKTQKQARLRISKHFEKLQNYIGQNWEKIGGDLVWSQQESHRGKKWAWGVLLLRWG